MSAFKSHKRKSSIKNEAGSPNLKNIKIEQGFPTPNKTPKQGKIKTPKSVKQEIGTPNVTFANKKTPKPKLEMFKGTGKLDFKTSNDATDKKTIKTPLKNEPSEDKVNRHKMRRLLAKDKRRGQRAKLSLLKEKAINGDESARIEIQEKLAALESEGTLSNTKKRKLAFLRGVLKNKGPKKDLPVAPSITKVIPEPKKVVNKHVQKKQQNGKPVQSKLNVKAEEDEQESSEEDDVEASSDEDDEGAGADVGADDSEEDSEDGSEEDDDEDGSKEEEEGDDDEESEEENDEEDEVVVSSSTKQPIPQQIHPKSVPPHLSRKGPGAPQPQQPTKHVVFVGNIAYTATENDLREHFKKAGGISDIRMPTNPDGKPRGFAFVEVEDEVAYEKALSLNNSILCGRKLNINSRNTKPQKQNDETKTKNFKFQAPRKQNKFQGGFQKRPAQRPMYKNKPKGT